MLQFSMLFVFAVTFLASCGSAAESTASTAPVAAGDTPRVSPGVAPSPGHRAGDACHADADCVLSTSPDCCSCCQCAPLHALLATAERARVDECAVIDCAQRNCAAEQCVPCGSTSASTRAVCRDGECAIVP